VSGSVTGLTPEAVSASNNDPSNQLLGSSITYPDAGPRRQQGYLTETTNPPNHLLAVLDLGVANPFSSRAQLLAGNTDVLGRNLLWYTQI